MVKSDLAALLASEFTNYPVKKIVDCTNEMLSMLVEALAAGRRVEIRDFGSFSLHYLPPRQARNPKTGKQLLTSAKYRPHFKPGKELREQVDAIAKK